MKIGFIGTGQMGAAIARRLHMAGNTVVVWNRTPEKLKPLVEAGLTAAPSIREAVEQTDVLFTMLTDDAAVEAVLLNQGGALSWLTSGKIHVSLSTLSVPMSRRLQAEHQAKQQIFLAAPVFGRPAVAEAGKLWIALAGETKAVAQIKPVLEAISRGVSVVGDNPAAAHALKIGGNFLITAMIQSLSEAFVFAEAQEVDPETFLETVNTALFQSPFYANYGKLMLHPPEHPGATVAIGAKDTRLFREAAQASGVRLPLADYFAQQLDLAQQAGMRDEDWAVSQYRVVQQTQEKD